MIEAFLKKGYHAYKRMTAEKPPRFYEIDKFRLDLGGGALAPIDSKVLPDV